MIMGTTTDKNKIKLYRANERAKREWVKQNDPVEWERLRKLKREQEKQYKKLHRDKVNGRQRRYVKKHPFKIWCKKRCNNQLQPFDLWKILKKQKMICALTGDKLTRDNISLDHIIPTAKGGTNEISNIRFVTYDVNLWKNTLLDSQLIELCRKVVRYQDNKKASGNQSQRLCEGV